jgi:hypothetical protein
MSAEFVRAEDNDPAKAETWTLAYDDGSMTVGWRKGSRWIAISTFEDGVTNSFPLTEAQMRQLGEIASRI